MACSLARSLDVVGEPWTPLIVRDIWMGRKKFDEIRDNLEISRKVLADRLDTLVREGVLDRVRYQERPPRYEYTLTEKGQELMGVLLALISWGDRWVSGQRAPMLMRHKDCGNTAGAQVTCTSCGGEMHAGNVRFAPGPGARDGWGTPWGPLLQRKRNAAA